MLRLPSRPAASQTVLGSCIVSSDGDIQQRVVDSPDMFTEGSAPFHRALPEVVSGEPVPPPYYTIFFRYREADGDTATVIDETSTTVYVPQVVKIEMTDEAYNEFVSPIIYPDTYWPQHIGKTNVNNGVSTVLYGGCQGKPKTEILQEIASASQALIPSDVNIRFATGSVSGRCKHACITTPLDYGTDVKNAYGLTDNEHCSWRNENPFGISSVFIDKLKLIPCRRKLLTDTGAYVFESYDPAMFPYDVSNLVYAMSLAAIHEVGHTMGLVDRTHLHGTKGHHNSTTNMNGWIMNSGECFPDTYYFRKGVFQHPTWKHRNAKYLNFILPRPSP